SWSGHAGGRPRGVPQRGGDRSAVTSGRTGADVLRRRRADLRRSRAPAAELLQQQLLTGGCCGSGGYRARMTKPEVTIPDTAPPTELVIEDLVEGDGAEATAGQAVDVHYVGVAWSTKQQFDSS